MRLISFFGSALSNCLTQPLQSKLDTWKKKILQKDKDHAKYYKKMSTVVKKRSEIVGKLKRKAKKRSKDRDCAEQLEIREKELQEATEIFVAKEKSAVEDIDSLERNVLSTFAVGWKQIIEQEFAMLNQIDKLGDVLEKIDKDYFIPSNNSDNKMGCNQSSFYATSCSSRSCVKTPTLSPYTNKSRSESCKSRNSFSSRHSSVDSHLEDSKSATLSWTNPQVT